MASKDDSTTINIPLIKRSKAAFYLLGTTPLILNRMSEKARHQLLMPPPKRNQAERQASFKHDPVAEFRASPYTLTAESAPTFLALMSSAFKGAMATAALDLPGTKKAQIGRLVYVGGDYTPVYGVPRLFMSVVRSADVNHTPDIRTRAIVPDWACRLEVEFVEPLLNATAIGSLLTAAGINVGVGDWRAEKGKGNYGSFLIVNADDPALVRIIAEGGREAQQEAMEHPSFYDRESEEMAEFWSAEAKKRKPELFAPEKESA